VEGDLPTSDTSDITPKHDGAAEGALHFPTVQITPQRANAKSVLLVLVLAFVVPIAVAMAALHRFSATVGGLGALGVVALIVGLVFVAEHHYATAKMKGMPPGGIFRGWAALRPPDGNPRQSTQGSILILNTGCEFTPRRDPRNRLSISWQDVAVVRLTPVSGKIGNGLLRLILLNGEDRTFSLVGYGVLAAALTKLSAP
jgi:hypothetical protein